MKRVAAEFGRVLATPEEARAILGEVKSALVKGRISLVEKLRWQGLPADG